jgi:type III secretion system YscI/HrpB-like protein
MDPISQKAAGGGSEIIKKMLEQQQKQEGPQGPGGGDDARSKFETIRQNKLDGPGQTEGPRGANEIDPSRKTDKLDPTRQAGALDPTKTATGVSDRGDVMSLGKTALEKLNAGHQDMDKLIKRLESGGDLSMKEMLAMQVQMQRISHQVDMTTKLVGKAVENVNKALNTQV